MAINKTKVMEAAQKLVEKGQLDKAIKEYLRVVHEDPKDVRVWLKVGDLYAKKNAKQEATDTYLKVAEFYGDQGFYLKAVAVFKQILKLDPRLVDVNLKLAQVYRQLGLLSDAMQQYEMVAAFYHREGRTKEALGTLRELTELDPENVATRIKLAELYSKEGMVEAAIAEFATAADFLRGHGRMDDFLKVAERLVWHQPDNLAVNRELAGLYLKRNDPRHALQKLQVCFKADPHDVETLSLLAAAFLALDQKPKTVSVWKEMARIYQERGQTLQAEDIFRKVLSVTPDDADAVAAIGGRRPGRSTGGMPPARPEPGTPVRVSGSMPVVERSRHTASVASVVERPREPSAAVRAAVSSAPVLPPRSTGSVPLVRTTHAFAAVPPPPGMEPFDDDVEEPTRLPAESRRGTIDLDVELELEELSGGSIDEDALPGVDPAEHHADEIAKLLTETDVYIKYGLHQKAIDHLQRVFMLDARNLEARERLKDLYLRLGREDDAMAEMAKLAELTAGRDPARAAHHLSELLGLDPDDGRAREIAARFRLPLPEPALPAAPEDDDAEEEYGLIEASTVEAIEVASADVEIDATQDVDAALEFDLDDIDPGPASGVSEVARPVPPAGDSTALEEPEQDWGEMSLDDDSLHPTGVALPERVSTAVPEPTGITDLELPLPEPPPLPGGLADAGDLTDAAAPSHAGTALEDDLDEADFFISQNMLDEARGILTDLMARYPGHPLVLSKMQELEPAAPPPPPAPVAAPPAPEPPKPPAAKKQTVIARPEGGSADADTHYDLGLAYKEMGLIEQAIGEFQMVLDVPGRAVQCHLMIGLCQLERGKLADAIAEFKAGLYVEGINEREALALYFELGAAYEQVGDAREAVFYFDKVHKRDSRFRDVERRLTALRSRAGNVGMQTENDDGILDGLLDE